MKSLDRDFIGHLRFTDQHLSILRKIGEYRGQQDLFKKQSKEVLENLKQHAMIESVESSNRLEQIIAPYEHIKDLVVRSTRPQNRSEREIAGYTDAIKLIHESFQFMDITVNIIQQIHTIIYRYLDEDGGRFKMADNKIIEKDSSGKVLRERFSPIPAVQTPQAIEKMCQSYNELLKIHNTDPLVILPLFILDFLCIHPFKDGNGRVSRLITLLILNQFGYEVGQYISLERIFEDSKESYYQTLYECSKGWHQSQHNPFPWMEYFWGVMISAYKEFERKVNIVKNKGSKTAQIKLIISQQVRPFSISDIKKECPTVSRDMIRTCLRRLRDEGKIQLQGIGRNAKWINITFS